MCQQQPFTLEQIYPALRILRRLRPLHAARLLPTRWSIQVFARVSIGSCKLPKSPKSAACVASGSSRVVAWTTCKAKTLSNLFGTGFGLVEGRLHVEIHRASSDRRTATMTSTHTVAGQVAAIEALARAPLPQQRPPPPLPHQGRSCLL